jgi:hypothetical protein
MTARNFYIKNDDILDLMAKAAEDPGNYPKG